MIADDPYWEETPNDGVQVKLRMKVLANSLGDTLYPSFNEYGDMNAFGRNFTTGSKSTKMADQ
jgi:hypothetical protein